MAEETTGSIEMLKTSADADGCFLAGRSYAVPAQLSRTKAEELVTDEAARWADAPAAAEPSAEPAAAVAETAMADPESQPEAEVAALRTRKPAGRGRRK